MIDKARVLRPLTEAEPTIEKLDNYENETDLASSVETTWQAVDKTLRNLLRADSGAPDDVRLGAQLMRGRRKPCAHEIRIPIRTPLLVAIEGAC